MELAEQKILPCRFKHALSVISACADVRHGGQRLGFVQACLADAVSVLDPRL